VAKQRFGQQGTDIVFGADKQHPEFVSHFFHPGQTVI
jgi:hypothetical protein